MNNQFTQEIHFILAKYNRNFLIFTDVDQYMLKYEYDYKYRYSTIQTLVKLNRFDIIYRLFDKSDDDGITNSCILVIIECISLDNITAIGDILDKYASHMLNSDIFNKPLILAAELNRVEIIKLILGKICVDSATVLFDILFHAAKNNSIDVVDFLVHDDKVDLNQNDNIILLMAIDKGYMDISRMLILTNRFNLSMNNNLPIIIAARNNDIEMFKLILKDEHVDPNSQDQCAMKIALHNDYIFIVQALLADKRTDLTYFNIYCQHMYYQQQSHIDQNPTES